MKTTNFFKAIALGLFFLVLLSNTMTAQVGINTTNPGDGSLLDISSDNKGLLVPRVDIVNLSTIDPIIGSTESLLVYNTDSTNGGAAKGFYYWNGTDEWILLGINILDSTDDWTTSGNGGTDILINYLGTKDDQDYIFRTNGIERMRLTYEIATGDARLGIGTYPSAPSNTLDVNGDIAIGGGPDPLDGTENFWDKSAEKLNIFTASTDWELGVTNDAAAIDSPFFFGKAGNSNYNQSSFYINQSSGNITIGGNNTPLDVVHMELDAGMIGVRIDNSSSVSTGVIHTSFELWADSVEKAFFRHKNFDNILEIGHADGGQIDFYIDTDDIMNVNSIITNINGNITVNGTASKGGGTFKIDHPLDPENKYLYHSFVESPDMMNIYDGVITTDANGSATIQLPSYFNALNKDFQYQFTTIGAFSKVMVSQEIAGNSFIIKSQKPNVKISWQVTGIRKDPYANKKRVIPEVEKEAAKKGTYLHPSAYNLIN